MTGLSEYRSKSAALLRIVTCAVIVLALLACDNGQPGTLTDNGEVMLTLRISLPTATDGSTATRAITSNEEKCNRHSPTESIGIQGKQFHGNVQL